MNIAGKGMQTWQINHTKFQVRISFVPDAGIRIQLGMQRVKNAMNEYHL